MKIAFFTESNYIGHVPRTLNDMRTDLAWVCALKASHIPLGHPIDESYDLGIVVIPKKNIQQLIQVDYISQIRKSCSRLATMQEGPHWYFQDYPLNHQAWFYNILMEMDFLFVHNEIDKKYYSGLTGKTCHVMPSLMIEDTLKDLPEPKRENVMIGGNFCHWYGGFDSYIVAQEFEEKVYIPSMGRKIEGEERMENLNHLPYMNWTEWIKTLNKFKYGVHLMRTHAAGTFALNCAYLGIPCIGYEGLDTQEICHSECTVELGNIVQAKQIAEKLRKDEEFYLYCSNKTKEKYKTFYHENKFKLTWNSRL